MIHPSFSTRSENSDTDHERIPLVPSDPCSPNPGMSIFGRRVAVHNMMMATTTVVTTTAGTTLGLCWSTPEEASAAAVAATTAEKSSSRSRTEGYAVQKTEEEWKSLLTPRQYEILRNGGTERPYSSVLEGEKREGNFTVSLAEHPCSNPM